VVEVGEKGWFFSGRKRLLQKLVDWLNTAEHGVRIVTGLPGAGKSAVMGRLATLSDAEYRQEAIDAGVVKEGEDVIPPVGAIDVAVHAKGKTARAWAKGLGVEIGQDVSVDIERFVQEIGKLSRKTTLMIYALDEAAGGQGSAIASQLIVPLGSLPRVRVLVGTRRSLDGACIEGGDLHGQLREVFGRHAIIDDLEDERHTLDDITGYVRLRLATSKKHRNDDGAGWFSCDKYLWRHLANHAAKAGLLDELICDPGYLAVADPARLVLALPYVTGAEGRRFANIYIRVVSARWRWWRLATPCRSSVPSPSTVKSRSYYFARTTLLIACRPFPPKAFNCW